MEKNPQIQEEQAVSQVSRFETFVKKYQKILSWGIIAVLVIVFGALGYNKWILTPAQEEAKGQMYLAEYTFAEGDFEKALKGDGNILGFAQIIDEFGAKAGESVYLYAGICAYNTGDFQSAIDYFKKYDGDEPILKGKALAALGDAYSNLEQYEEALAAYKKATKVADNAYTATYLFKAAGVYEKLGQMDKALETYKEIKNKYEQTPEGFEVEKYISRIENK